MFRLINGQWVFRSADDGGGQVPLADPPADPLAETPPPSGERTYTEAEAKALRDEAAARRRELRDVQAELEKLRDASKSEAQRLQDRAEKLPQVEQERDALKQEAEALKSALSEVVDAQKKRLGELDKDMLDLLPDGSPTAQLAWLTKAVTKAEKDAAEKAKRTQLPPGGGRNPGAQNGDKAPTEQERQAHLQHTALRF